jgi:hypothetical protein
MHKCLVLLSVAVLLATVGCGSGVGRPAPGADSPAEADLRNEEQMASFPAYSTSVLIEKEVWDEVCCHPLERYRLLTYVYASDATMDEIIAFYRGRLTEAGWRDGKEVTGGHGFHRKNIDIFITPLGGAFSEGFAADFERELGTLLELVSVRSPNAAPPDASLFFAVTTSRRIDCLRSECYQWPTGS